LSFHPPLVDLLTHSLVQRPSGCQTREIGSYPQKEADTTTTTTLKTKIFIRRKTSLDRVHIAQESASTDRMLLRSKDPYCKTQDKGRH
jgi:hypothetical protein